MKKPGHIPDSQPYVVEKPWGREEWLAWNDVYAYKRIYIRAGHRTSLQFHREKLETNYIIAGEAECWMGDDVSSIVKKKLGAGDFFTVIPGKVHRIVALTDLVLQEVSSPQLDDVVRLEDDSKRGSGRIEIEHGATE